MMRCDKEGVPKIVQKIMLWTQARWRVDLWDDKVIYLDIYSTVPIRQTAVSNSNMYDVVNSTSVLKFKIWDECFRDVEKYVEDNF